MLLSPWSRDDFPVARIALCALLIFISKGIALAETDSAVVGPGLLGQRYVSFGYEMARPNDDFLREFASWSHGFTLTSNRPIAETWDLNAVLTTGWFEGDTAIGSSRFELDSDITDFQLRLNKYFRSETPVKPFAGIGVGYQKLSQQVSVDPNGGPAELFTGFDRNAYVSILAGFEWEVSDRFVVRPQIETADTFEDFNLSDVIEDNVVYGTQFIYWWNDCVFTSFGLASDFDDTDVQLEFVIGVGNW